MIQLPKLSSTAVWNPNGFHAVKSLQKRAKFNSQYYVNNILIEISNWRRKTRESLPKKFLARTDDDQLHTSKMSIDFLTLSEMKKPPHPPNSPNLAPSDLFLLVM
jgi:hypothetical protein